MIINCDMTDTASVQSTLVDGTSNQTLVDQQQQLERSTDVWFDDGTCVLQAENTVFKVYFGLLAKYSVYFQTIVSLPQPDANSEEPQPMYENCPLIVLLGDSAVDAKWFLKALTDIQFYTDAMKIKDVSIVLSVINMSLKYQADILLRRSIPAFSAIYTANFARWDMRHTRRQYRPCVQAYGRALPYVVIALAKKAGMDMLLPSAMFECCSYSVSDIMDGVAGPDGKYVHLDHETKKTILQARVQISNEASATKTRIVQKAQLTYSANINGGRQNQQNAVRKSSWEALMRWANDIDGPDGWVNPFKIAESWPADAYHKVTQRDGYPMKKNIEGNYKHVWMRLPEAFGLQEWYKLRRSWVVDF